MAGAMFTGDRFVVALRLGFEGKEELALQELKTLHAEGLNDEERGWVVLYEVRFLGQLLRVSEARKRLAELSKFWGSTPEHDVRIGTGTPLSLNSGHAV